MVRRVSRNEKQYCGPMIMFHQRHHIGMVCWRSQWTCLSVCEPHNSQATKLWIICFIMKEIVVDDNVAARQCVAVVKKLVRVRYDNDDMREMREYDKEVDL